MTKRQREQVVELLRCAADQNSEQPGDMLSDALDGFGTLDLDVQSHAWAAVGNIGALGATHEEERALLLEAAARVEEGSWP